MTIALPAIPSPRPRRAAFAWQGWQMSVPAGWNVTALGGRASSGHALLADLDGPRLGIRWKIMAPERVTPESLEGIARAEADADPNGEVSHLLHGDSAAVAYLDPESPGRDVYVAWSPESDRVIELVYHARERDDVLVRDLVPSLRDTSRRPWQPWSVLDLSCAVPAAFALHSHDLRAGELQLHWTSGRRFVSIRQLALAEMALQRTPLEQFVRERQRRRDLHYRAAAQVGHATVAMADGREVMARCGEARRRSRFFWHGGLAPQRVTVALHDCERDRIVTVEADQWSLARDVAASASGGRC